MIWKKFLSLLPVLLLTGCVGTFTRLTPDQQLRNANNLYPVEVSFSTKQQSVRWDSVKPYVLVNGELYPLRPVPVVPNRWEGLVPVPPTANSIGAFFRRNEIKLNGADAATAPFCRCRQLRRCKFQHQDRP
jgi:hypothetical protein